MLSDIKFALRNLSKTPGFTLVALLTLALAIGINTAVFALMQALVFHPLVADRPEQVVNLFTSKKAATRDYRPFSYDEYRALRESSDLFADVAAVAYSQVGVGRGDSTRRSFAVLTSETYFTLLGTRPMLGRFFTAEECRPNASQAVVVTGYSFWQRAGGRADFVGSTLTLNGRSYTVIGVTPREFSGLNAIITPDLWIPLGTYAQFGAAFGHANQVDLSNPRHYPLSLLVRLAPGVTQAMLTTRLPALAARLTALQPEPLPTAGAEPRSERTLEFAAPSRFSISNTPAEDGPIGILSAALFGMAGCVLLIASLNLANMLLARGTVRRKEIALRLALGATRWRIVRQLLVEGLVLAVGGGLLGLLLSVWANDLLLNLISSLFSAINFTLALQLRPDASVLVVTLGICVVATLFFSLGPALRASRVDLVEDLKTQGGEPTVTGRFNRFFSARHCLVMAQLALSAMLLFGAGLFVRGAMKAGGLDLGFTTRGGVVVEIDFTLANTPTETAKRRIFAAVDRLRQQPGVRAVAVSTMMPYANLTKMTTIRPAADDPKGARSVTGLFTAITGGYFDTIDVRILRGRDFTTAEARDQGTPRVAIVDEAMARRLFPNGDALGQRVRFTQQPADGSPAEMEIVGICTPHRHDVLDTSEQARLFVPFAQSYAGDVFLHIRLATDDPVATAAASGTFRRLLLAQDSDLPILQLGPFSTVVERNLGLWIVRLGAVLFGVFGGIALLLAVVGVYGVKAYAVSRRTREIGIRMALGAHPRDIFALLMRQSVLQLAFALAVGVGLSLGVGRVLATMLYQVSPTDALALGGSLTLLSAAALVATFIPARRATHVNPTVALRTD